MPVMRHRRAFGSKGMVARLSERTEVMSCEKNGRLIQPIWGMKMTGMAAPVAPLVNVLERPEEILPVLVVLEHRFLLIAARGHMIYGARYSMRRGRAMERR